MRTAIIAAGIALAGLLGPAAAPARAGAATDQLRESIDQVTRILADPALRPESKTAQRRAAIRRAASAIFDFRETARRSLGRHWQGLSEGEREEFVAAFTDLLEAAYVARLEQYSGEQVVYNGERLDPGGDVATVRTRLVTARRAEVPVDYRMRRQGQRWLVYDLTVEGVSLISNYRSQFNKIIETASARELLERLRTRSQEFRAPGTAEPGRPGLERPRTDSPPGPRRNWTWA